MLGLSPAPRGRVPPGQRVEGLGPSDTRSRERLPCPSVILSVSFLGHIHTTELPSHTLTAASVHPFPNLPAWIFRSGGHTP